jgi:hypothetical protein
MSQQEKHRVFAVDNESTFASTLAIVLRPSGFAKLRTIIKLPQPSPEQKIRDAPSGSAWFFMPFVRRGGGQPLRT